MRKIMFLLSMVTICVSCAKEMNPSGNSGQTPSASGVREFIATMENVETKTALGADLNVKWSKGDEISVFDEAGTNFKFAAKSSGTSVTFTQVTEGEMVGSVFYAIYPYKAENTIDLTTGKISSTMNTDKYNAGPGNFTKVWHNIMTARTDNNELKFKNLAALVKFTIPEGLELSSFYFATSDYILASNISVAVGEDGTPSLSSIDGGTKDITINPSNADTFKPGVYYMPILPGTFTNFRVLMTWASGSVKTSDAFGLTEFKADRNKVINLGTLYDNREYYKWMNFENGIVNPMISWWQTNATLEVVGNPCSDDVNSSSKVLKSDASALSSGIHGGFDFDLKNLNSNALKRIKAIKCQIYITAADNNTYFPHLQLSTTNKILPSSINGIKPSTGTWDKDEYKNAFQAGQWNTFVFPFDPTITTAVKLRPMMYFEGGYVSGTAGSRVVYLDNIGFSYIEE